ncbi:MAG: hypothetical protein AAGI30_12930, partial [Planctomycetota bacterium]
IELLVVVSIVALLLGLLLPALARAREAAGRVKCMSHVRQNLAAMLAYSVDTDDYPSWSWTPRDIGPTPFDDIRADAETITLQTQAVTLQAMSVARERLSFPEDEFGDWDRDTATWVAWPRAWTLLITDYLDTTYNLPETGACPEDAVRVALVRNSDEYESLNGLDELRELFSDAGLGLSSVLTTIVQSTYVYPPAFYDSYQTRRISMPYDTVESGNIVTNRMASGGSITGIYNTFYPDRDVDLEYGYGDVSVSNTAYPSGKAMLFETNDRHSPIDRHALDGDATPTIGFADGSVRPTRTRETSFGWSPRAPSLAFTQLGYFPNTLMNDPMPPEPQQNPRGDTFQYFMSRLVYTRGGLKGMDVGGQPTYALDNIPDWYYRDF